MLCWKIKYDDDDDDGDVIPVNVTSELRDNWRFFCSQPDEHVDQTAFRDLIPVPSA